MLYLRYTINLWQIQHSPKSITRTLESINIKYESGNSTISSISGRGSILKVAANSNKRIT